ncbi:MAG TPA: hypothetical protein VNM87_09915, partial [Candidatus Udaeobacter sp.]|nr:hypothetical protein [Candidatus Udaeobacter sp.]
MQRDDLLGIRAATSGHWHPDAIGLVNVGIDPTFGDPPANWRKQVALELASLYCPLVSADSLPAFLLEGDFHVAPSAVFGTCGEPYTTVWVPENWRTLPPMEAKAALFTAIRERRALGSVGAARFTTLEIGPTGISLQLSAAIRHLQLWGGDSEPLMTWSNVASASYPLAGCTEPYLFWFAYGDTLSGGGWNAQSCTDKQLFFTSPLAATGPGTFSNPFAAAARAGRIPVKVLFHQHSNLSPDAPNGPTYETVVAQCRTLGIDAVLMTDHLPGNLADLPTFTAAWDVIPPPNPQAVTASGNGLWSSTIPDAPWPGGNVPHCNDAVTIPDGRTVTINCNALCQSLTVGQGGSGILEFDANTPRALTISGDLTIKSGAALRTASNGNVTGHSISIGGNLINDGIFDLYTAGGSAGGELTFVGQSSASFSGSGPINDLRKLTVNKGSNPAPIIDIHPANFLIRGKKKDSSGFLTLLNGTLRFSGTFPCTTSTFSGNGSYIIKSTCGLWIDDPAFILSGRNGATTVNGRLQIDQGVMQVGTDPNNVFSFGTGSQLRITGGLLQVAGRMNGTGTAFVYEQSGGRLELATAGNLTSSPAFDLGASTSFIMSGGVIAFARTSFFASIDYRVNAASPNLTGGEVRFGTGTTPQGALFRFAGPLPNLVIDGTTTGKTAFMIPSGPTTRIYQSTTVEAGSSLNLNGGNFYQRGPAFVNHGALFGNTVNSQLVFEGTGPQTVGGTGTFPASLATLKIDNPTGITFTQTANLPVLKLALVHGAVGGSSRLTIGQGGATPAVIELGAVAGTGNAGELDQAPIWNLGSSGLQVTYFQETAPRTTGFEIPT